MVDHRRPDGKGRDEAAGDLPGGAGDEALADDPRHLLAALERFQQRVADAFGPIVATTGHRALRGAHRRLLSLIPAAGCRPTTLAERAGITKQAVGELLRPLVDGGYVEQGRDGADRRAVIVRRTATGDDVVRVTAAAIARLEAGFAAEVGGDRYAAMVATMWHLAAPPGPAG